MNITKKRWLIVLGAVLFIGLVLLALFLGWFYKRGQIYNSRPLVLLHSPTNNERVQVGDRLVVHATAREDHGVERIEFWANGYLVEEVDAENPESTSLVLSTTWVPDYIGHHLLIVQAISRDGIQGQSSISIVAYESEEGTSPDQGEEGGEIPGEGVSAEEAESGPEGGRDPGPGEDRAGDGGPAPLPDSGPPLLGLLDIFEYLQIFSPPAERITLKLEVPRLRTSLPYEGLHCYLSLAGSLPQWYPDGDHNQATDESFPPLSLGWWDTEQYLVGNAAPVITWPEDEDIPVSISCVGISAGGSEAIDLGTIDLHIAPGDWDGTIKNVELDGDGGQLYLGYRVTRLASTPHGVPIFLDPDMTVPTNVRLDDRRNSLKWDYEPGDDEEAIDGFRIYLNGTLQWVEDADDRESGLPYEWFNPPCGSHYTFAVTAFRVGFPDGPESLPGIAIIDQTLEDCNKEIQISFISLETFDLGGDGRYEDRHGDIGPVYGQFFANEKQITFDAGHEGSGVDMPNGFTHNTVYDLSEMSGDRSWHFSGMNGTIVDVPPGGVFEFGFHIMDRDTGRCNDSGDPGCDDLICEALSTRYEDNSYGELDRVHEGRLTSDNDRCRLTYSWGPAFGSPVGTGIEGDLPLPWLSMTDFYVSEETGAVEIKLRNTGTATWPWKDLVVELQTRSGDSIGFYTWPEFVLETGEETTLTHPDMFLEAPFDACVVIDPYDDVPEGPERSGAMFHGPICAQLPDLIIYDAIYETTHPEIGQRLRAFVQNTGDGSIVNRSISFDILLPDGSRLFESDVYPSVNLEPGERRIFEFPGLDDSIRSRMMDGYSITVNPEERILEEDSSNNTYIVGEGTRLWLYWLYIDVPYDVRNSVEFEFDAYLVSGRDRQQVADWAIRQDIDWGSCFRPYHCIKDYNEHEGRDDYDTYWFDVYGDQALDITITAVHPGTLRESFTLNDVFTPPTWGGSAPFNYACSGYSSIEGGAHHWVFAYLDGEAWSTRFNICRENATRD
jgi:hypothetical protein